MHALLIIQIIISIALVIIILIQKPNSDGIAGLSGGSSGGDGVFSGRASANLLTRITAILATCFLVNSLIMATISARNSTQKTSIINEEVEQDSSKKIDTKTKDNNKENSKPSVPLAD